MVGALITAVVLITWFKFSHDYTTKQHNAKVDSLNFELQKCKIEIDSLCKKLHSKSTELDATKASLTMSTAKNDKNHKKLKLITYILEDRDLENKLSKILDAINA